MLKQKRLNLYPYLLVLPALIMVITVVLVPVLQALSMSLQSYDLRRPTAIRYIAFDNYAKLLKDPQFWNSLRRTLLWVVFGVGLQFLIGFELALILNKKFRFRGFLRAVSLIPWVTPGVLIGLMWRWIFDGNQGVLNELLLKIGLISEKIPFLSRPATAFPAVIVAIVWQGIPFFAVMILAGLQGISQDLYEAAAIDGVGRLQELIYITIPGLRNTIFVTTLLRIIWLANSVDAIFNMTEGGPAYATQTLSVYTFNKANALDLGYASTMAVVLTLLLSLIAIPYLKSMFRKTGA